VLDHATSQLAVGTKVGFDATRKLPGEGFTRPWPPLLRMEEAVIKKVDQLLGKTRT
jgi:4-hydroxy-3-polyprenylbenzoate decarboxylase